MKIVKFKYGEGDSKTADLNFDLLKCENSLRVILYLGKIAGGAFGKAISEFSLGDTDKLDELKNSKVDISKLGDLIPVVMDRIHEKETIEKINLLLSTVTHDGNVLDIDYLLFDGRLDLLFKVLKIAFMHNYGFFFNEELFRKLAIPKGTIQK